MPEKDPSPYSSTPYSPLNIINYKEKGWVNVGNTRMVFFDVKQGFFQIRRLIEKEVGENSSFAIFQAGIQGGYSFLVPMLKNRHIYPDASGFLLGISNYSEAGFGNFELIDLKWEEGFAIIQCRNAIEGWAYVENRQIQKKTVCDYTRGIFFAFMKATHKFAKTGIEDKLDCIETSCVGRGDPCCEYIIAGKEVLRSHGFDLSKPRMSIQKQLKEMVRKKTREITRSLKCIEQLKEYNESIIDSITNGIMALDRSFNILTWNRGMEQMLGVPAKRVLGKDLRRVSQDSIQNGFFERCKQVMETGMPLEERGFKLKTNAKGTVTLNFKILPLFNERREVTGVTVFHEDISEKEKIELKYRNLFEKARDGIFVTDPEGSFISVNEAAEKIFGSRANLNGRRVYQFVTPSSKKLFKEIFKEVVGGKERDPFELEMISREGMRIPVEISLTAIWEDQKATRLQIIMRDISERKKIERQLIQASKMSAVGELASGVAHEINNPLASIAGYAEDLLDKLDKKEALTLRDLEEFPECLNIVIEQAYRCKEITKNLLNFARNDPLRPVRTNLIDVVNKALALVEYEIRGKNIGLAKSFVPGNYEIFTDPSQLQQVFLNILKNALEAVGPSGQVRISTHYENGKARVTISDNGMGIPAKDLKNIFDPFFTTKPPGKGTGLGLAICYMIMERLKGRIDVESEEGKGSTFSITLPKRLIS